MSKADSILAKEEIAAILRRFAELIDAGLGLRQAARHLGKPVAWFTGENSYLERFTRDGLPGLSSGAGQGARSAQSSLDLPAWFVPAAKFFYLISNLRREGGSVPEAILRTIELPNLPTGWNHAQRAKLAKYLAPYLSDSLSSLDAEAEAGAVYAAFQEADQTQSIEQRNRIPEAEPDAPSSDSESVAGPLRPERINDDLSPNACVGSQAFEGLSGKSIPAESLPTCPPDLKELITQKFQARKALVPRSIAKQIRLADAIVQRHRSPHASALDNLSAPGSQRRYYNQQTGQRQIMRPGDWFGGDDSTPGIAVCVPCNEVNTPCSQKFQVLLGRFQWLAFHDARTDKLLAWDYVVRPRGSYRAEDILNGMGAVTRVHGIPRVGWQFEGGNWYSKIIQHCIQLMGCEHHRTYSPHQKAIESIYNRVWTRLAVQFPHADMGRYRNENEDNCKLYEDCKKGHKDPRRYFPPLELVLQVLEEEIAFHNTKRIVSGQYGTWIPDELFDQHCGQSPLRPFSQEIVWIFSPFCVERQIRGMNVTCKVPMFEDFSVPFDFSAPWMPLHRGKRVRLHFNPREPKCRAKIILLEDSGTLKSGHILGDADLIGETAQHIRTILNWASDDQRAGYLARQKTAQFLSRHTRAIGAQGRVEYAATERRDGLGQVSKLERSANPVPDRPELPLCPDPSGSAAAPAPAIALTETRAQRAARLAQLETLAKQSR